ncbi:hypothetical protein G6L99_08290 [Agrobacterium rhizogenes]|uniref:hypothetical protein n=1 Tax=Rhizobium rhizogenes TaxID=359 RepID=UPI001571D4B6|nr:hypothetical protein [Rhizobium rhizogenes]NTH12107.1 hypothetical protein [Rhizobium rhizogenes]
MGAKSVESRNGTMIILEGTSDLPFDRRLIAKVHTPGKDVREAICIKDRLHSRPLATTLNEGFLLVGVDKSDLEDGTQIEICCDAT